MIELPKHLAPKMSLLSKKLTNYLNNRVEINANWLMKLRWVAIVGQVITISVVAYGLNIPIQKMPLLIALAITTVSNIGFALWLSKSTARLSSERKSVILNRVLAVLMVLDLAVLTALLFVTGGHANPFVLFYFVNLALAGMLLPSKMAWSINGLSILCFASLFYWQVPLADLRQLESLLSVRETGRVTLSQYGFFIAFSACSSVIIYFVTKLTSELVSRDQALRQSQIRQARSEKWEALGTLAAGAAHELATPLTTIAVVSTELQRDLELQDTPEGLVEDFKTIRAELEKCRGILDQMSTDAGHLTTELPTIATIDSLLYRAVSGPGKSPQRVKVNIANEAKESEISVPIQSFCMALGGIVQNALDASPEKPVEVIVSKEQQELCILVSDQGEGMSKEVLARADDPFFSTKETGRGMGLGRFLARTVFERLGGSLDTVSQLGVGTEVTIRIPLERRD